MTKLQTGLLTGTDLERAVSMAERIDGRSTAPRSQTTPTEIEIDAIIDRERISTVYNAESDQWGAGFKMVFINDDQVGVCWALDDQQFGPTRRIAAMRAYAYRKLGNYVDTEELGDSASSI